MDLIKIMAEADADERACNTVRWSRRRRKYVVMLNRWYDDGSCDVGVDFVGTKADCEAHLSRLCAAAQLRALQEAGLGIAVRAYITKLEHGHGTISAAGCHFEITQTEGGDLIPPALEACNDGQ